MNPRLLQASCKENQQSPVLDQAQSFAEFMDREAWW
jgi:hypothetical protein